jgi:CHASE3 domain sensor protein
MSIGLTDDARPQMHDDTVPVPFLRPLVDWVAGIRATVHQKLLAGFLLIALLLLSMGVLSIFVLNRLNQQVETLNALNQQAAQARDMIHQVTLQSHLRAMALLTLDDVPEPYTPRIAETRREFERNLAQMRTYAVQSEMPLLDRVDRVNSTTYEEMSQQVTDLFLAGDVDQALKLHISQEHETRICSRTTSTS